MCAARTGIGDDVLAGLPELSVGGLGDSDALALLLDNVHGPLDAAVCDQIVAESHGNPLALLELPRTWSVAELAGGFGFPAASRWPARSTELRAAPPPTPADTQLLVLAAAAEPLGDPVLLHRAAESLGSTWRRPIPAVDAGLLKVGGRVEFAHPLVRSAAYRSAAPTTATACIGRSPMPPTPRPTRTGAPGTVPRRARARRGGRRRARALGRPGAGSRRGRGRGGVPAARGRADR